MEESEGVLVRNRPQEPDRGGGRPFQPRTQLPVTCDEERGFQGRPGPQERFDSLLCGEPAQEQEMVSGSRPASRRPREVRLTHDAVPGNAALDVLVEEESAHRQVQRHAIEGLDAAVEHEGRGQRSAGGG